MAAASMSKHTRAVCVVLSTSSMVRIFDGGDIVNEIVPERWMLRRYWAEMREANDDVEPKLRQGEEGES